MKTKIQIIKELKSEHPTLRIGDDEQGYTDMIAEDYDAVINGWADNLIAEQEEVSKIESDAKAKETLLTKLGITSDEAKLLLS